MVTGGGQRQSIPANGLPETRVSVVRYDPKEALCVVYKESGGGKVTPRLTTGGGTDLPMPTTQAAGTGIGVDSVVLPPGSGVVASALASNGQAGAPNSFSFIGDDGRKYPLKNADAAKALGYTIGPGKDSDATPVPADLLRLLPQGPGLEVLDPKNPPQANTAGNVRH